MDFSHLERIYDSYYSDGYTRETWVDQEMIDVILCLLALHVWYGRSPSSLLAHAYENRRFTYWSEYSCRFIPKLIEYNIAEEMMRDE